MNRSNLMAKQSGSVSVFMLVMLGAMLIFSGWVIDIMRSYSAHNQLASATDASMTSAILSRAPQQDAQLIALANLQSGVVQNYRGQLVVTHQRDRNAETVRLALELESNSLNLIHSKPIPLSTESSAAKNSNQAEVVFMLDVSNSMKGRPLDKTKQALTVFAERLFANTNQNQYVVSIVPASGNVNTGPMEHLYLGQIRRFNHARVKQENLWRDMFDVGRGDLPAVPGRKRGAMCRDFSYEGVNPATLGLRYFRNIEQHPAFAPANSRRILRPMEPPIASVFENGVPLDEGVYPSTNPKHNYKEYHQDKAIFDDIECHVNPISPFLASAREMKTVVNQLVAGMNTNNAEGMVWAARLLSPFWQGQWDRNMANLPRYYSDEGNQKYLVVFTDGEHKIDVAYRDKKMKLVCAQLKRRGVEVIAVNFGGISSKKLLQTCSSGPSHYHEASLFNVEQVFEVIAEQVVESSLVN